MLDGAAVPQSLGDAYRRISNAERALRAFGTPITILELSEPAARELHTLRSEVATARRDLDTVAQRIRDTRLEFFE
ncbi:MAG: hypothetical protein WCL53_02060 [Chloroflexota bacterium]